MFDTKLIQLIRQQIPTPEAESVEVHLKMGVLEPPVYYLKAYAGAAGILWNEALSRKVTRDLSQPILYMQRHTVELALKSHLDEILELWERMIREHELHGHVYRPPDIPEQAQKCLNRSHSLSKLRDYVELGIQAVQARGELHPAFGEYISLVEGIEMGEPSRFRYSTVRSRRGRARQASYPEDTRLPLGKLYSLCSAIIREGCDVSNIVDLDNPKSLLDELVQKNYVWSQMSMSEFDPLTKQTEAGRIQWRLCDRPLNESVSPFVPDDYLKANVDGRNMVIVGRPRPGREREFDFAIGVKTTSKTVEFLTWLEDWDYGLVRAAVTSSRLNATLPDAEN